MNRARLSPAAMQQACDQFNGRYRLNDEVTAYTGLIGENPKRAWITSKAEVLSGHTPVVYVTGEAHGAIALTHIFPGRMRI